MTCWIVGESLDIFCVLTVTRIDIKKKRNLYDFFCSVTYLLPYMDDHLLMNVAKIEK